MGGEELKWHQLTHNQLMSPQGPHFCAHSTEVQIKPKIKVQISGKISHIGISDVVTASVYSEKTRLKKLMLIMNKSQESMVFGRHQKLTSAMKGQKSDGRLQITDFKIQVSLHREPPEVGLLKKS